MKTIYALLGAPGVGKTTFIKKTSEEMYGDDRLERHVIGPDLIRAMVQSPVAKPNGTFGISQENESFVWTIVNDILDKKTERGELIIVDATHSRNKAITNYKKYADIGYRVVLIDFSDYADLATIQRRNHDRDNYKLVPEHVIETMYERIQDLDIPGWVEVITPAEFKDHLENLKFDWSNFDQIVAIGDIHGCANEFNDVLERAEIDPDTKNSSKAIVLVGDYFDRGYGQVEVFKMIQSLRKTHYVLPLLGNHEEPLAFYKDYVRAFTDVVHGWIRGHVIPNSYLAPKIPRLDKYGNKPGVAHFIDTYREQFGMIHREPFEEIYPFEAKPRVDMFNEDEADLCKTFIGFGFKQLDTFIEDLKHYPTAFASFEELVHSYRFNTTENTIKPTARTTMKKFLLSDITYVEVSQFHKSLAQLCYVNFHGRDIVITHGGLASLPTKLTPTADMIRGVGGYEDTLECDKTFFRNTGSTVIGIHGHRNTLDIPITSSPRTYNINGDVDLGLRALIIHPEVIVPIEVAPHPKTMEFIREKQILMAQRFKAKKLTVSEEGNNSIVKMFQDHTHIDVRKLPGDIASVNFTRKAFEKGYWDSATVKARGLFLDTTNDEPSETIIARGYEKFFNLGERNGIGQKDLQSLTYPVMAFEKPNGFFGILSVDDRDPENKTWFTSSKTTTVGDYADNFRKWIEPHLSTPLMNFMHMNNVTLVFEVIDPVFDPHIQTYGSPELVFLDAIKNQLDFKVIPYHQHKSILSLMKPNPGIRVKKLLKTCEKTSDITKLIYETDQHQIFSDDGHEGFVFVDSADEPQYFKYKSKWYSFWKRFRSQRDRVSSKLKKAKERGRDVVLTKSESVEFKSRLHTAEDIKAFKALHAMAEENPDLTKSLSIPDLRKKIIERIGK